MNKILEETIVFFTFIINLTLMKIKITNNTCLFECIQVFFFLLWYVWNRGVTSPFSGVEFTSCRRGTPFRSVGDVSLRLFPPLLEALVSDGAAVAIFSSGRNKNDDHLQLIQRGLKGFI